ncbi:MAG: septum formation protein Maf [Calditrichaeota bacterium]|mgnify:FL=1|jgi:septum formation protein|nr:septum formation protein Maf [Calditrichota bacterium]MBT7617269.1 septum formation protein Maf [Calditrichota bacterium]MBT7787412.1 septum formation protein Maf [Calditrichota bacterium]
MKEIILASTSPRRQMLLKQVQIPFTIMIPDAEELFPSKGDFAEIVMHNAKAKASSVIEAAGGRIILGADTIVDIGGVALGKPVDIQDAFRMLNLLSGNEHNVYTGVALVDSFSGSVVTDFVKTQVRFRMLTAGEIDDYISTGEPMDKAGSYGIQERGALFIESIQGCFFNVMGLPLSRLWELLKDLDNHN